jgi:F-type H+-transporting ATPase subunit b
LKDSRQQQRFSNRFFLIAATVMLIAGLTAAPLRVAAQQENTSAAPAGPQSDAKPGEGGESSDEKQVQAFRLEGPVVKWTAKTLNISNEASADIFEIANFLIIALALGIPLIRVLPKFLRNRKEKVRADIESARRVTEDANARLSAVEAKMASLDDEIRKFRAEVEAESKQDEARIKASLGEESARIVESAEQEIGQAAAQARRGLRNFAADLAIDQAAKQLNLTAQTDHALIAEFAADLAAMSSSKSGGRN